MVESNILPKVGLDHWHVHLWVDTIATPKLKPFIFEKFWLSHPDFQELAYIGGARWRSRKAPKCTASSKI
jgi:hypothetical protein